MHARGPPTRPVGETVAVGLLRGPLFHLCLVLLILCSLNIKFPECLSCAWKNLARVDCAPLWQASLPSVERFVQVEQAGQAGVCCTLKRGRFVSGLPLLGEPA